MKGEGGRRGEGEDEGKGRGDGESEKPKVKGEGERRVEVKRECEGVSEEVCQVWELSASVSTSSSILREYDMISSIQ